MKGRRLLGAVVALVTVFVVMSVAAVVESPGGTHHSPVLTNVAQMGLGDQNASSRITATDKSLFWTAPRTSRVDGHTYPLFTDTETVLSIVKAKVAQWADTAWCGPLAHGQHPDPKAVASLFLPGSPGRSNAEHSPRSYTPPPTGAIVPATGLDFAPVPPGPPSKAFCMWVGNFPRISTTGGTLNPPPNSHGDLGHQALYGTLQQVAVPVDLELSYVTATHTGQHVFVSGNLIFVDHNGDLAMKTWTPTMYWEFPAWVPSPTFLLSGKYHWNYAGAPMGKGMEIPDGAATAS